MNRTAKRGVLVLASLASLVGCGGESDAGGSASGGGAGAAAGGSAGSASGGSAGAASGGSAGAASGGTAGAATGGNAGSASGGTAGVGTGGTAGSSGGAAGAGSCVPQTGGSGGFSQPTCADLNVMTVSDPKLTDAGNDGTISPGEDFTIAVNLNEVAGLGFNFYPTVQFTSDTFGIAVSQATQFFAILACQSIEAKAKGSVMSSVPPGTKVTIQAQVAALNMTCPSTHSIQIPFTVQ